MAKNSDGTVAVSRSLPELARTWGPGSRSGSFLQRSGTAGGLFGSAQLSRTLPVNARVSSPTLPRVSTAIRQAPRKKYQRQSAKEVSSLSGTAKTANNKAERFLTQYATALEERKKQDLEAQKLKAQENKKGKKPTLDQLEKELEGFKHRPDVFEDTVNQIGSQITTLTKNIRMDHLAGDGDGIESAVEARARERAEKRRAIELMRARKKEQEARDPHRKVALRLENTRRFKQEEVDKMDVPMAKLTFNGAHGAEKEALVDVRKVRSRCLLIDEGKVDSLMDLVKHREVYGSPAMNATAPAKMFSPSSSAPAFRPGSGLHEARIRMQERILDRQFERLNGMRGEPTQEMLKSLEDQERRCKLAKARTGDISQLDTDLLHASSRTDIWKAGQDAMRRKSVVSTLAEPRRKPKKRIYNDAAATLRALKHWEQVRFAVSCYFLYEIIVKKRRACMIVVDILRHCGEWLRVQNSMFKILNNVKKLQRAARNFISTKRKRIEVIEKDWQLVEQKHLAPMVKAMALAAADQKLADDTQSKARCGPDTIRYQKIKLQLEQSEVMKMMYEGAKNADWRHYCIPARDRKEVCSRYYMILLKKRIKSTKNLYGMVQLIVRNNREMNFFFRQFGVEQVPTTLGLENICRQTDSNQKVEQAQQDFWYLSEDTLLDLIALVAKRLSGKEPWRDHPANREVPGNVMYRPNIHAAFGQTIVGDTPIRTDILRMLGETADLRQKARQTRATSAADHKKRELVAEGDLEDVFGSLTPRALREYSQRNTDRIQTPASRSGTRASRRPRPPSQHLLVWEEFGGNT